MPRLFDKDELNTYCKEKFGSELAEFKELGKGSHGTGFIIVLANGKRYVLKTLHGEDLGQNYPADRAQVLLCAHYNYNKLTKHVKSVDVGAFTPRGLKSVGDMEEFFLVMEEAKGDEYQIDLDRILEKGELTDRDRKRALVLADYLADIHSHKHDDPSLYKRRIREAIGHNELMMGVLDIYPDKVDFATNEELTELVKKGVDWWNKTKHKAHRLSTVHGDFYFSNIAFNDNNELIMMDRSRGEYGEPAEDVACILINNIMYAYRQNAKYEGPFKELNDIFMKRYLEKTNDHEILEVLPLFTIGRSVIIFCPSFNPDIDDKARRQLFDLTMKMADKDKFDLKDFEG